MQQRSCRSTSHSDIDQEKGFHSFLVRESLGFEEFQEALVQLKEEKDGIDPSSRNFDLPDMSPKGDGEQWGDWRRWRQWQPPTEGGDASVDQEGDQSPTRGDGYRSVPTVELDMSPTAASIHGRTFPPASQPGSPIQHGSPIPGVLGPLDSFILEVLRGWRLLVAASLSNEEWRDVLAATGNKLDYISISNSLQTLWDEQLGSSRHAMMGQRTYMNNWHEQWDVSSDWHDTWSDDRYSWASHVAEHTWPEAAVAQEETSPAEQADDPADPDLQEALDAERQAEALMSEARRTWSQAQQATAMLQKDRGFGKASGSASTPDNRGCFICGSF